jgi:hypothetical protein
MSWKATEEKEREKPKFLKQGSMVTVDLSKEPIQANVDGKFGKREMYIIDTNEYGNVYVSIAQLLHIASVAKGDFKGKMTVEL